MQGVSPLCRCWGSRAWGRISRGRRCLAEDCRGLRSCGRVMPCQWSCRYTRGAMVMTETRRGSRRGRGRCRSRRSQGRRRHRRKVIMQLRQAGWEWEGQCRIRCSQAAWALRRSWICLIQQRVGDESTRPMLSIPGVQGPQLCGCAGRRRSNPGEDASASRS